LAFQDSYGLATTGECDEQVWSSLIEASWTLGERLLFLRSPNIRGDDVASLQSLLNRLGFDCGRVDGIYGPRTSEAVAEFQENIGLPRNGISTPEFIDVLKRMGSQTGDGPGVAVVREGLALSDDVASDSLRLVVGYFTGGAPLASAIVRRAKESHPLTSTVDFTASEQAKAANAYQADVYIGCESSDDAGCTIYYYEVPTFCSVGGRNLALRIAAAVSARAPELHVQTLGVRHPVLRETRMTAVLCSMGPHEVVLLKTNAVSTAICDALDAWRDNPAVEI
jgi:N-acetylmuramoyl-L-alanine amidase